MADHDRTSEVQSVVQEAKGAAADVIGEARATGAALKGEAGGLANKLRQGLESQVEQQKNRVAQRVGALADRMQNSADEMRGSEAWLAELIARGARELGGVAADMERNDVAGILGSAEVFARRQPALFVGAAVALGFALTRVARSGDDSPAQYPDATDESRHFAQAATRVGVRRTVPGVGATEADIVRGGAA